MTLGHLVGLFIFAFVLAGVAWLVSIILRCRMTTVQFMSTFTIATGFAMMAQLVDLTEGTESDGEADSDSVKTVFAPAGSDFAVTFSRVPTVEGYEVVTNDGVRLKCRRAYVLGDHSFQRVEMVVMPRGFKLEFV